MHFLFSAIGILGFLCSVTLISVIRRSFLRWISGMSEWAWACVLLVAASLAFGEGAARSTGIMRLIANAALLTAILMMYASLKKLANQAPAYRPMIGVIAGAMALLACFTYIDASYTARALIILTAHVILFSACSAAMLKMQRRGLPEQFTLFTFVLLTILSLLRLAAIAAGYESSDVLEGASFYQKSYLAIFATCVVGLTVGYMLIIGTRLRDTLRRLAEVGAFEKVSDHERAQMERELNQAAVNAELVIHFQPRVSVRTGAIVGVEALVRWNHPTRGLLLPSQFIPLSEETDSILVIGEWVLQEAARVLNRLHTEGSDGINMSVNVSARQIGRAALPAQIDQLLKSAKFKAHQVELELTESSVVRDQGRAELVMMQLKNMGVRLSVDDFGTGYSSLAYIKRWPIDCVKIDRSFVSDIPHDSGDVAITRAIVAMGHALGLSVVAEGVENSEQLAFLQDLGCDEYQGYLASEPLPEPELFALLASWVPTATSRRASVDKDSERDALIA